MSKHTPAGPGWAAQDVGHGIRIGDIAWLGYGSAYPKETHKANARLIEASPDLMEAFEKSLIRAYTAGHQRGHEDTVESIFTEVWAEDIPTYFAEEVQVMLSDGSLPEAQAAIAKATGKESP